MPHNHFVKVEVSRISIEFFSGRIAEKSSELMHFDSGG